MTERVRVAALPDGTPVEELPLSRRTSNVLRAGSVLTLGDLRAMPDRELRRLRGADGGPVACAGARGAGEGGAVTTADRALEAAERELAKAEARRPWLAKVLDGLRRKGS